MSSSDITIQDLATDAYQYEVIRSTIGAVIATIISIIFIVLGAIILYQKKNKTHVTRGTITSAVCNPIIPGDVSQYNCELTVRYNVNGVPYRKQISTHNSGTYSIGDIIDLDYDPNNPSDVQIKTMGRRALATFLIILGILLLIFTWGYFYMVRHNKAYGTAMGFRDLLS